MTYNRFEDVSLENALPCKAIEGQTYSRFQPISPANPYPVMVVDLDAYTPFQPVSEANPFPIATGDGDAYTIFQELSEANRLPVVIVEGQSYSSGAEVSMTNPYPVIDTTAEAPSYTGPLDLVPGAVVAYGQRAMSAAMCGQPYATLRRASDDAELQFSFAADGTLDTSAITTWAGGDSFLKTWNDGSGNSSNVIQATASKQPKWNASGLNTKPTFEFSQAAEKHLATAGNVTFGAGLSVLMVVDLSTIVEGQTSTLCGANYQTLGGDESALAVAMTAPTGGWDLNADLEIHNWESDIYGDSGIFDAELTPMLVEFYLTTLSVDMYLNGVALTVDDSDSYGDVASVSHRFAIGADDAVTAFSTLIGKASEVIAYGSVLSGPNQSALRSDIMTFYGIS